MGIFLLALVMAFIVSIFNVGFPVLLVWGGGTALYAFLYYKINKRVLSMGMTGTPHKGIKALRTISIIAACVLFLMGLIGIIQYFMSGETSVAGRICGWCEGWGCSRCKGVGSVLGYNTIYSGSIWGGVFNAGLGAAHALMALCWDGEKEEKDQQAGG